MEWEFKAVYIINESHLTERTIRLHTKGSQGVSDAWVLAARVATENMEDNMRLHDLTIKY